MVRLRRLARTFAPMGLLLLAAACTTASQTADLRDDPGDLPVRAAVADVPFFAQERYYCGPAAVAMTLAWTGLPVTQEDLVPQVYTPGREGTLQPDVVSALRRNGRMAVPVDTLQEMLQEIAAGRPVLVFQNLGLSWLPQWHFAVAIGYDLESEELVLHTGTSEARPVALATFERTWARGGHWALVVLKPDQLPVADDEIESLRAAAGLERVGRLREAETAYRTIAARWPRSFAAHLGLGNTRYALDDFAGAEAAYRDAIAAQPDESAPAWNNLAYVLAKLGRLEAAVAAAERAVELGGAEDPNYRATLAEISAM